MAFNLLRLSCFVVLYIFSCQCCTAEELWKLPLDIDIADRHYRLYIGQHPQATDFFDIGLDTLAPPIGLHPYATLWIDSFPHSLQTDFREFADTTTWTIRFFNTQLDTILASWEFPQEIESGKLLMNDSINMAAANHACFFQQAICVRYVANPSSSLKREGKYPNDFRIAAQPNPFSLVTTIQISNVSLTNIKILNILGQIVQHFSISPINNNIELVWDGRDVWGRLASPGVYLLITNNPAVKYKLYFLGY